ncbi:MAG: helix-turn-helix domain-containing protein [Myxococcota bacterium]
MGRRDDNKRAKREASSAPGSRPSPPGATRASIEQIAAAAGVARGTFYLYFPDKLALFEVLMDRWYAIVDAALAQVHGEIERTERAEDLVGIYRRMALSVALPLIGHLDVIEIAMRESRQPGESGQSLRRRELAMFDRITAFTAIAMDRGWIRGREPRLVGLMVFGAVERLLYEVRQGVSVGDPLVVAEEVLGLFAAGLGLREG